MKKILAIVLALSMALSVGTAFAAEAPQGYFTANTTVKLDGQLLQMMMGGGDEMLDAVIAIINKLEIVAAQGENGSGKLVVNANGTRVGGIDYVVAENGVVAVSELFPSYAVTVPAEIMAQLTEVVTSSDASAMPDFSGITAIIEANTGETAPGEYSVNGKTYAAVTEIKLDSEAINALLAQLMTIIKVDLSQVAEMPDATEEQMEADLAMYSAVDGSVAMDVALIEEGEVVNIMLIEYAATGETAIGCTVYVPESIEHETWDAAIAALNAGEDAGYVFSVNFASDAESGATIDLVAFNGGQYMLGGKLDAGVAGIGFVLNLMSPDMALISAQAAFSMSATPAEVTVNTEGLTLVDISALMGDSDENAELKQAFMTDFSYGMSLVMVNLMQALPDEMTTLVNLMTPVTTEVTTTDTEVPAA